MPANFLLEVFKENNLKPAIIWDNKSFTYQELYDKVNESINLIDRYNITKGSVIALQGDFTPSSISLLIALIQTGCIIVPLTNMNHENRKKLLSIAQVEFLFEIDKEDKILFEQFGQSSHLEYYEIIRKRKNPGLVLFSSGTSGDPKAAVHDLSALLKKFQTRRRSLRTINFLLFDHWGGLNTMFYILSNVGVLITTKERSPEEICKLIEYQKVELLPASPTFINLLLLSGVYNEYDLTSLKVISYGTEPMPENTLLKLKAEFPKVKLLQTYGLIELGVMHTRSEKDDSLWVKVGGDGYKTRIVDGILQIKAESAMLGYLNAPSPFTKDNWFITGDEVLEKDGYIKILGRKSEMINVGGEKVYPQEIENIIMKMGNVAEVTVYGEKNSIIGNIVCANILLIKDEGDKNFIKKLKQFCKERMEKFKIPVKVQTVHEHQYSSRYKKNRIL